MLVEDRTAFVETIDVTRANRKAEKIERSAIRAMLEFRKAAWKAQTLAEALSRKDLNAGPSAQRQLARLRQVAAKQYARAERLQLEAVERRACSAHIVMHRLHSRDRYVDCSERRFARLVRSQQAVPVCVTSWHGIRWWWFQGRFWWDDEGLDAEDVRNQVLELTRKNRDERLATDRARSALFGE
jgi:hypothetical protein